MTDFAPEAPLVPAPLFPSPEPAGPGVLVGPLGLRAGWGLLVYVLLAALLGTALFLGLFRATGQLKPFQAQARETRAAAAQAKAERRRAPAPVKPMQPVVTGLFEVAQGGAVLLSALALSFIERRRFRVYGLELRRLRDAAAGAGWGLTAMVLLIAALRGFHLLAFDARLLPGVAAVRFGAEWLLIFLLVGLFEEFLFRGYLQFTLMRGLLGLARRIAPGRERLVAFSLSALVWSGLFLLAHTGNTGETAVGLVVVFLAGIVFSYALWRTGSLWWGIGAHMTWDWAQSFLFGVPDSGTLAAGRLFQTHPLGPVWLSGGVDGPEGSILVIPAMLLLLLAIRLRRPGPQPPVEPETLTALADAAGGTAAEGLSL